MLVLIRVLGLIVIIIFISKHKNPQLRYDFSTWKHVPHMDYKMGENAGLDGRKKRKGKLFSVIFYRIQTPRSHAKAPLFSHDNRPFLRGS